MTLHDCTIGTAFTCNLLCTVHSLPVNLSSWLGPHLAQDLAGHGHGAGLVDGKRGEADPNWNNVDLKIDQ